MNAAAAAAVAAAAAPAPRESPVDELIRLFLLRIDDAHRVAQETQERETERQPEQVETREDETRPRTRSPTPEEMVVDPPRWQNDPDSGFNNA